MEPDTPAVSSDPSVAPVELVIGDIAKTAWPELLGTDVDLAVETIERERPDMLIVKATPEGSIVTTDVMACRRVRVWYDPSVRLVSRVPLIG